MAVEPLPAAHSADRAFSCLDQMKRIKAAPHTDDYKGKKLPCSTVIHVGIFFDGTNNNMERYKTEVLTKTNDPSKCSHSNVVVLHDAFKNAPNDGYYRFYIPGVGTPFDEEIDALPADLPEASMPRKRILPSPKKPTLRSL